MQFKRQKTNLWIFNVFTVIFFLNLIISCTEKQEKPTYYPVQPVDIRDVKLTDNFWLPIIQRVQEKTIEFALEKCKQEGRFENFLIAGGQKEGEAKGAMPFDDTDVYKIIEGASNTLISAPNEKLSNLLDSLIAIIAVGQEEDGYLTTWRTINPAKPTAGWVEVVDGKRWESLNMSHELYNAGHLYEAAVTHYRATGKRNFLNIALKNADLIVEVFGDGEGQISDVPGHQIIETGLIKLFQVSGDSTYLKQAKYFLDNRGNPDNHRLYGEYAQDHKPVVVQEEVVGHAVRAVYMYAAMTDIAAIYKDTAYLQAVNKLWSNMVHKKMYLTGGIGATHSGEAFGGNYHLPNLSAYNETCAAIGDVYWNNRLFKLTGDVKYNDVVERTLYNAVIPGISLEGTEFFYPNPLESDGVYKFNQGACTRKEWFNCSCCPSNLIRFLPSVSGLIYAKQSDTIYVNQFISNRAKVELNGQKIQMEMKSELPWSGKVVIQINTATTNPVTLKIRVPGWARNEVLPGDLYSYQTMSDSKVVYTSTWDSDEQAVVGDYLTISRKWESGDELMLDFPMEIRKVLANELVEVDSGKVALEYGPMVYAFEEIDNPNMDEMEVDSSYTVKWEPGLLKGVNTLVSNDSNVAIPYYTWSNRGIGKMKVWIDRN